MNKSGDPARLEQLERAFESLHPEHQEMIFLARVRGLTYAEIGERLGLTVDQVERRMAKAIYALDRALHPPKRRSWRFW